MPNAVEEKPIRVFAATPNPVTIWGLRSLLDLSRRPMVWAGHHPLDDHLLKEIERRQPRVVVCDGALDGAFQDLPGQLHQRECGLLMLCSTRNLVEQESLVRCGARGVVHMGEPVGTLLAAIEQVAEARLWMGPDLAQRVMHRAIGGPLAPKPSAEENRIQQLTRRERAIIATLVRHPEAKAFTLGSLLAISEFTVRNHLSIIYRKLELRGRAALVMFANRHHLA